MYPPWHPSPSQTCGVYPSQADHGYAPPGYPVVRVVLVAAQYRCIYVDISIYVHMCVYVCTCVRVYEYELEYEYEYGIIV